MTAVLTWLWSTRAKCWTSWSFWYRAPFQDHTYLFSTKQRYEKQVFIVQVIKIADVWWTSVTTTFKAEQSMHEHTCMLKLPNVAQQNSLFLIWIRKMYLAGCKLHIQTVTFLIVLTLKQYVNAKTIWGLEVWNINRHDDYCQPLTTHAASILGHSWSFSGEASCFWTKSVFYPWQSSVCILPLVCT